MNIIQPKATNEYTVEDINQFLSNPKLMQLFQLSGKKIIHLNEVEKAHNRGDLGTSFYESKLYAVLTDSECIDVKRNTRSRDNKMSYTTYNSRYENMQESNSRFQGKDENEIQPIGKLMILQNTVNVEYIIKLEKILIDLVWKKKVKNFKEQLINLFNIKHKYDL